MKTSKRVPKFRNAEEEAKFWDTHSITEYTDELKEVNNVRFPKPRKRLISVRFDDAQIKSLKEVASTKGIGYLTLVRMWIAERLSKERRDLRPHRS